MCESIPRMEQFYRENTITPLSELGDLDMHIIEWWAQDELPETDDSDISDETCMYCSKDMDTCQCDTKEYTIRCFGSMKDGQSVTCTIKGFLPFYYVKVSDDFDRVKLSAFVNFIKSSWYLKKFPNALVKWCIVKRKDLFGFRNGRVFKFVKLVFSNHLALMKSRYLFKKPVSINGVTKKDTKFKLYESNVEGFMRYCHIQDIRMAGWIRLPKGKYTLTTDTATTQLEIEVNHHDVIPLTDVRDIAKFLQASWDIEVYSEDYTFPDPKRKKNEIFQIATTYKYMGDSGVLVKHLLTLKKCAPIKDSTIVVEECKNEKDLITKWVDTISNMDPDILYTYNGDGFDCMYLIQRAKMYNLIAEDEQSGYVLERLSRLSNTGCVIRKEVFSSSAYGDSEFTRLYFPGRLNYDLLIHYKRGMKKYPSYKLDNIATAILKEGKHDVGPKDIFQYYEQGTPERIREIGEYCVQDTELLQKLVDKQIILTTIIQLANVTFVPIGYLTTRGQTIKVYSQLLRKARQMEFLVPHTNFNEDAYPMLVKMEQEDVFSEEDIGRYIQLLKIDTRPLSAKISQVIDSKTVIVLSSVELTKEYYRKEIVDRDRKYTAKSIAPAEDMTDNSFTGATVLEPTPGLYTDNIAVLDFASLYPTIMISRNLCYSTFVMDDKYANIHGVKYETIAWEDKVEYKLKHTCQGVGKSGKSKGMVCGKQAFFEVDSMYYCRIHDPYKKEREPNEKYQKQDVSYKYTIVQPHIEKGQKVNQGVLPALLEELYAERKQVKKHMAKAVEQGDKQLADILDSTQLAIKVSLNSIYGYLGRCQGNLVLKELGSIVTSVGRMLIEQSKDYAEHDFLKLVKEQGLVQHQVSCVDLDMNIQEQTTFLQQFKVD